MVKGLQPATGPLVPVKSETGPLGKGTTAGSSTEDGTALPESQHLGPSPQDSVSRKNHVPTRSASDSSQRPQRGFSCVPGSLTSWTPKGPCGGQIHSRAWPKSKANKPGILVAHSHISRAPRCLLARPGLGSGAPTGMSAMRTSLYRLHGESWWTSSHLTCPCSTKTGV